MKELNVKNKLTRQLKVKNLHPIVINFLERNDNSKMYPGKTYTC